MKFIIDFNVNKDINSKPKNLVKLGAKKVVKEEYSYYEIEISTIDEMSELSKNVNKLFGKYDWDYSLILDFDEQPTIYLDNQK